MKTLILACLLFPFSSSVNAQTTAEDFFKQGERKSFESYGKEGGPAVRDAAIADLSSAIKLKPDYHDAYNFRGNMKVAKGDLDGAVADYSKAIEFSTGPRTGGATWSAASSCSRARITRARWRISTRGSCWRPSCS